MTTPASLTFDGYQLDPGNALLLRDGEPVALTPKAFAMLVLLCQRPGQLLSKDELLDAIWQTRHVSEGVLKNTVQELRQALGDDARSPRYIGTVHRRGYRFLAEVEASPVLAAAPTQVRDDLVPSHAHDAGTDAIVGRDALLDQLDGWLDGALRGKSATVFVNGEPGIGKTALMQTFARRCGKRTTWVQGQCVDQYGQGEPYLPLLEAIGQLARLGGETCVATLHRYAPTWLAQLPWLVNEADRARLARETQGVTRERMLRELAEFLRAWTQAQPLLLAIEDLHWSDHATLDALTYLTRRKDGVRLMILGSYRPVDVLVSEHPFKQVRNELILQGLCRDLALELLSATDVADYLRRRFAGETLTGSLIEAVYRRTEGLPLFLVRAADEMADIQERTGSFEHSLAQLPDGLKHLIDIQFDRLSQTGQRWLEAAAVSGEEFTAAQLASVTQTPLIEVEAWCEGQARAHHLLHHIDSLETGEERYTFIHAYYRELAYARLPSGRKAALHGQVGAWLEAQWGGSSHEIAAELALHFEKGQQYEKAAQYLHQAAMNALNRHAPHEAAELLQRGIRLADKHLPDSPEQQERTLGMLTLLPPALIATRGYSAAELGGIYQRALELSERVGKQQVQCFTLYGSCLFHMVRGELDVAISVANQLLAMAENGEDPIQRLAAHLALGTTLAFGGKHIQADKHFDTAIELAAGLGEAGNHLSQLFGQDPLASMLALRATVLNILGYPERSLTLIQEAHDRAEAIGHPYTQTFVLFCTAWLYRDRDEPDRVQDHLPRFEELSISHGFPIMINTCQSYSIWVSAVLDKDESAAAHLHRSLEELGWLGTRLTKSIRHHQIADALMKLGRYDDALEAIDAALYELIVTDERRYEAETWRLRGNLLLKMGKRGKETPRACYEKALAVAHAQGARLFELRAAYALANLTATPKAIQRLREVYAQFTEGFDMPDLQAARDLLTEAEALG